MRYYCKHKISDKSNSPRRSISVVDGRLARVDNLVTVVTSSGGPSPANMHQSSGSGGGGSQHSSPTPGGSRTVDVLMGGLNNTITDSPNSISSITTVSGAVRTATIVSIKQESLASIDSLVSGGGFVDSTTFLHSPVGQMVSGNLGAHGGESGESLHDDGCGQGEQQLASIVIFLISYFMVCA